MGGSIANGAGLGLCHQTGWTGFIAKEIQFFGLLGAKAFLERGQSACAGKPERVVEEPTETQAQILRAFGFEIGSGVLQPLVP
jgi:hypothetical protein